MPFVYILYSKKYNKTYTGSTVDLESRLKEHNSGSSKSIYTSQFGPWKIIHYEKFENLLDARKREKYYKSSAGKKKLKKILYSLVAQW